MRERDKDRVGEGEREEKRQTENELVPRNFFRVFHVDSGPCSRAILTAFTGTLTVSWTGRMAVGTGTVTDAYRMPSPQVAAFLFLSQHVDIP